MSDPISKISGVNSYNNIDPTLKVGAEPADTSYAVEIHKVGQGVPPISKETPFITIFNEKLLNGIKNGNIKDNNVITAFVTKYDNVVAGQKINLKDSDVVNNIAKTLNDQPFMKIEPNQDVPKWMRTGGMDSVA